MFRYIVLSVFIYEISSLQAYEIPEATIEILHPKGFTVSIPDQEGIQLFAFHGKINEEFEGREDGQFSTDINYPNNGKWTFSDRNVRFNIGDTIYYWLYVDYFDGENKQGYLREHQKYVVTYIPKNNGNKNKGNQGNQGNKWNQGNNGNKGNKGNKGNHGNKPNQGNFENQGNENQYYTTPNLTPAPTPAPTPSSICNYSPTKINGENTCSGKLIFIEEFNELNDNKWQTEIKFASDPDYEFVIYGIDRANTFVDNGQLHIKPTLAEHKFGIGFSTLPGGLDLGINCTGTAGSSECKIQPAAFFIIPPILSGKINSRPSFSFTYGRIDVRAKLPKGDWIYPELFLTPKKYEYGSKGHGSGEISIAFLPGNANYDKELEGGITLGESDEARKFGLRILKSETSWNEDFHIFSVIWKPVGITLLVDDKVYGNISPPPNGFASAASKFNPDAASKWKTGDTMAPLDKEMIITVGVGVGGNSFDDTFPGKPWINTDGKGPYRFHRAKDTWLPTWNDKSELIVDYIKVHAI